MQRLLNAIATIQNSTMIAKVFYLAIGTDQHGAARLWASGDTWLQAGWELMQARMEYERGRPECRITVAIKAVSSDSR
ncbi:MAG: hypothetical protein ACYTEQ_31200 [Planctomycetota bacterium]|jgi:hypothetical protein